MQGHFAKLHKTAYASKGPLEATNLEIFREKEY